MYCIDQIQKWLSYMGIASGSLIRQSDDELLVIRRINEDQEYKLHIWEESDGSVIFQSLVTKAVVGSIEAELNFYQTLLMFNGLLGFVDFGMEQTDNNETWGIFLNSVQYCKRLSARYLKEIIDDFDTAYSDFIPVLISEAERAGLRFIGQRRVFQLKESTKNALNS